MAELEANKKNASELLTGLSGAYADPLSLEEFDAFPQTTAGYQLDTLDINNDKKVSFDEYKSVFLESVAVQAPQVDDSVCDLVVEKLNSTCQHDKLFKLRLDVVRLQCQSGISALSGYSVEQCLLQSVSCDEISACFKSKYPTDQGLAEMPEAQGLFAEVPAAPVPAPSTDPEQQIKDQIQKGLEEERRKSLLRRIVTATILVLNILIPILAAIFLSGVTAGATGGIATVIGIATIVVQIATKLNEENFDLTSIPKWLPGIIINAANGGSGVSNGTAYNGTVADGTAAGFECDVWMYWSANCGAISSENAKTCSNGGNKIFTDSCVSHFKPGSRGCGFMELGCKSACIDSNLSCDDEFKYESVLPEISANIAGKELKLVQGEGQKLSDCRFNCRIVDQCAAFVYAAPVWAQRNGTCHLFSDQYLPDVQLQVSKFAVNETTGVIFARESGFINDEMPISAGI